MKGGLLSGLYALRALRSTRGGGEAADWLPFERLTFIANPDEEIGSPIEPPHIEARPRDATSRSCSSRRARTATSSARARASPNMRMRSRAARRMPASSPRRAAARPSRRRTRRRAACAQRPLARRDRQRRRRSTAARGRTSWPSGARWTSMCVPRRRRSWRRSRRAIRDIAADSTVRGHDAPSSAGRLAADGEDACSPRRWPSLAIDLAGGSATSCTTRRQVALRTRTPCRHGRSHARRPGSGGWCRSRAGRVPRRCDRSCRGPRCSPRCSWPWPSPKPTSPPRLWSTGQRIGDVGVLADKDKHHRRDDLSPPTSKYP